MLHSTPHNNHHSFGKVEIFRLEFSTFGSQFKPFPYQTNLNAFKSKLISPAAIPPFPTMVGTAVGLDSHTDGSLVGAVRVEPDLW